MNLFKTKSIAEVHEYLAKPAFKRVLTGFDLFLLSIGVTIGSGIFVLTGISAANYAGPAIMLSFLVSGIICIFTALAYAELASVAPISGSAYTYTYITMGESIAWIVGWSLILEYILCASTLASGWSGYVVGLLRASGLDLPDQLTKDPFSGGVVNIPAMIVTFLVMLALIRGTKESSLINKTLVFIKLLTIFIFVYVAAPMFDPVNWNDFFPFGVNGMITGAAVIFYAYVGFDAVTTSAEECKNPRKDIPLGLVYGLIVVMFLYIIVAGTLTGIVNYSQLNNAEPLAYALRVNGSHIGSALVATGAIAGITTALLVMIYGQSRILFTMSKDGLLPKFFSKVHTKYNTPHLSTIFTGFLVIVMSGFMPIHIMGSLSSLGTLVAFSIVTVGVIVLRFKQPNLKRVFKCPGLFIIGPISIVCSCYLMSQLIKTAGYTFLIWNLVGVTFYFVYGVFFRKEKLLNPLKPAEALE